MLMRFRWLASAVMAVLICLWVSCGGSSTAGTTAMYVATQTSAQIFGYRSNINSGNLSSINGSPFAAGAGATGIVIDPTAGFAFVANTGSNDISRFSISANGTLVAMTPNQVLIGTPGGMAMDASGKFLFVTLPLNNAISIFAVSSGNLTEVPNSPFSSDAFNIQAPIAVAVSPKSNFLYIVNQVALNQVNGSVSIFSFDTSTGELPALNPATPNVAAAAFPPVQVGTTPSAIAISPGGSFVYVTNSGTNNVNGFAVDTGATNPSNVGDLVTIGTPFPAGLHPVAAAIDPSGQFLYVVNQNSNTVSGYRIAHTDGKLTTLANSPYNTGAGPVAIGISPANKFLYVSNNSANTISTFSIDPPSGNIGPTSATVSTGSQPAGIAFAK
jgi:6-phosphogluconolactonase